MNKLDSLYEFAAECDIDVINRNFSSTKKAACMYLKPFKLIVLDKPAIKSRSEEVELLAEEIGHYETGGLYIIESTYNTPASRNNRIKYEARARQWGYRRCLSPSDIEEGYEREGHYGDNAVAMHCGVSVEFLYKAIEYHRSCGVVFSFDGDDCA